MRFLPFSLLLPLLAAPTLAQGGVPVLALEDFNQGSTAILRVTEVTPGNGVQIAASLHGAGPSPTPYGLADLSPPFILATPLIADGRGMAFATQPLPAHTAGTPVWLQAADTTDGLLSNSIAATIGIAPVGMAWIPGGFYQMGNHHLSGSGDEKPVHPVAVYGFWIDTHELRNYDYAEYLNDAYAAGLVQVSGGRVMQVGGASALLCETTSSSSDSQISWDAPTSTFSPIGGKADFPMHHVSWYGACTYANWLSTRDGRAPCYDPTTWDCDFDADGFRLPTEAEWEYAARGEITTYNLYPWGDFINGSFANYRQSGDPYDDDTTPVGYYDGGQIPSGGDRANSYGLYDVVGNVFEFCHDWYDHLYYNWSPVDNPRGPNSGTSKVTRGGAYYLDTSYARCAARSHAGPGQTLPWVGFRLVTSRP